MPIARSTRITPQEILHHWGIRLDAPLEPMPALTNAVARSGPYVVRSEQRSRDSVRWEHDLLRFLAAGVPEVIAPLRARDGSSLLVRDDEIVSVFPYVEGDHIDRTEERVRAQLPPVLGRIHRRASAWTPARQRPDQPSYRELDFETNLWWDCKIIERTRIVDDAFVRTRAWIAEAPRTLATTAIHGDLNPGNVLMSDGKIAAVLDWSFACLDWPAFDLACLVGLLALQSDGSIDTEVAAQAIATYQDAGGTGEPEVLVPLLRLFFLSVSLFSLTTTARGGSQNPEMVVLMERALSRLP